MREPRLDHQNSADKKTGIFLTVIFSLARLAGLSSPPRRDMETKTSQAMNAALENGVSFDETVDSLEAGLQSGINSRTKKK